MKKQRTLNSHTKGTVQTIETLFHLFIMSMLYYMFWQRGYQNDQYPMFLGNGKYVLLGIYAVLAYLFINNSDGFQFGQLRKADLYIAQWIGILLTNFVTYFQLCLIARKMVSVWPMLALTGCELVFSAIAVIVYKALYNRLYAPYNMIMVYGKKSAAMMKIKMDSRRDKYQINAMISADLGLDAIFRELANYDAVVLNEIPAQKRNDILKFCYKHGIRTYVIPKITDIILRNAETNSTFDTPMLLVAGQGLTIGQRIAKRTLDLVLCVPVLLLASPFMIAIAIAIHAEDGGPVFYKQERTTINGRKFNILKFRSMIVDAEKDGQSILATGEDPRITKTGKIIRACRMDELPQLLNIIKGDMSIVGPRPERVEHMEKYCAELPEFAFRQKVKGGLTGYAQIYGKYNTCPYDKIRLDMMYIEHYSLALDIKLILLTIRILFSKESTEGFDAAQDAARKAEHLLDEIVQEETGVASGV